MTELTVETSRPTLTVATSDPSLSVDARRLFAGVVGENNVDLSVEVTPLQVTVSGENNIDLSVESNPIVLTVSAGGSSGGGSDVNDALVGLSWGSPSSEVTNVIEITGQILAYDGSLLLSSLVDIEIVVTDGAVDGEPSATAYLTQASSPVGTVLAGSGTATLVIRSSGGSIAIAVHEASAGHRFLWIKGAGHERLWVRAVNGVQELVFV